MVALRHVDPDLPAVVAAVKPADCLPFYATVRRRLQAALHFAESGFPYRPRGEKKARMASAEAAKPSGRRRMQIRRVRHYITATPTQSSIELQGIEFIEINA